MNTNEKIRTEALEFLMSHKAGVLATSRENVPHASTIYYIVDESFNFYFLTESSTTKAENISSNPNVALSVGTGPLNITVGVSGKVAPVSGQEKTAITERLMDFMMRQHVDKWPLIDVDGFKKSNIVAFKLVPESLTFLNLDDDKYPASVSSKITKII